MIVVTGFRSGTSLMMQTLRLLGIPIVGLEYHEEFSHVDLNPKGYFNLPLSETSQGINSKKYVGRGIKLHGASLIQTNPKLVKKIIVCTRDEKPCIDSVWKLLKKNKDQIGVTFTRKMAAYYYYLNKQYIDLYIDKTKVESMEVKFENILANSEHEIERVRNFLNIKCDLTNAILNVGV